MDIRLAEAICIGHDTRHDEPALQIEGKRVPAENLFRMLKSGGRLDELRSDKPAAIPAFIAAALVGWALTQLISTRNTSGVSWPEPRREKC